MDFTDDFLREKDSFHLQLLFVNCLVLIYTARMHDGGMAVIHVLESYQLEGGAQRNKL